jgi:hypothetical protein
MIQDVDEALRTLVRREAIPGADVDVAFDAPTREWASRRNAPTLDLYLYDIREDLQRREVMWQAFRNADGFQSSRQPPPRYYKLSYLVTAWTQRPEDEHRLLSAVLSCLVRHERLPGDVLPGALATMSVYATIALPPPSDRPLSDIWSALGGELKPSLDLVIIAPLPVERVEIPGPPVMEAPRFLFSSPVAADEAAQAERTQRRRRAGAAAETGVDDWEEAAVEAAALAEVGPGASPEALDQARVRARARLRTAIEAEAAAIAGPDASPEALDRARAKARDQVRERAKEPMLPDETIRSGKSSQPGRTVRLRVKR